MAGSHFLFFSLFFAQTKCAVLPPGSAVAMLRAVFQDVHVQVKLYTVWMLLLLLDACWDY